MKQKSTNLISITSLLNHLRTHDSLHATTQLTPVNVMREEIRLLLLTEPEKPQKNPESFFVLRLLKPFRLLHFWFSKLKFHQSE